MLIPLSKIIEISKPITGILHIGAYLAEELTIYLNHGISDCIFIEANPFLFNQFKNRLPSSCLCFNEVISDKSEDVEFYFCSNINGDNLGCSSLFKLDKHAKLYPMITETHSAKVKTITIDELFNRENIDSRRFNFLNMDIQGAELKALKGALKYLKNVDTVMTEFAVDSLYKGGCQLNELDDFFTENGFERVITKFVEDERACKTWGDSTYIRR